LITPAQPAAAAAVQAGGERATKPRVRGLQDKVLASPLLHLYRVPVILINNPSSYSLHLLYYKVGTSSQQLLRSTSNDKRRRLRFLITPDVW